MLDVEPHHQGKPPFLAAPIIEFCSTSGGKPAFLTALFNMLPSLQIRRAALLNRCAQLVGCSSTAVYRVDLYYVQSQLLQLLTRTNRWVLRDRKRSVGRRI